MEKAQLGTALVPKWALCLMIRMWIQVSSGRLKER